MQLMKIDEDILLIKNHAFYCKNIFATTDITKKQQIFLVFTGQGLEQLHRMSANMRK